MDNKQRQLLKKNVDLIIHRWRLVVVTLLLAITMGLGFYFYVPKVYESTAVLSYEQRQINPAKMDPEEGKNRLQESLATLKEVVTSRSSLEKVILQFSLYEEARKELPIEDVIEGMRKKITITPSTKGDIFSVSFQEVDPLKVMKVTNALASLFIEENLKYREERATETSKYTERELALSKKVIDAKEEQMRDYKLQNFNEMPEQRESNLNQLKTLIEQNQGIQNSIQELERTKVMVQEQAGMYQRLAALRNPGEAASASARGPETNAERLQRLRAYLIELQGKYTEKHPEVRRTKQMIAQLEGGKGQPSSGPGTVSSPSRANVAADLERQRMLVQLQQIDINIKQLRETQAGIPAQIAKYQRWVEAAPIREAEWNSLTRDYNELRRHYDQLVAQNLQAQSTQNIEQSQKGSKFKVVDSARLPEKPIKPNFLKILLVAVGAGLGFSFICILGLDFADTSFRDVGEIEEYVGVPVVCAIPFIEKEAERLKERFLFRISVAAVSAYGAILLATIAYMWSAGMIIV